MQTFLPYPSIQASLNCLDNKRLGKQRVEALQIINALTQGGSWVNHPAVLMWDGYLTTLKLYHNLAIKEWQARGFQNNMELLPITGRIIKPWYFWVDEFHNSHRSNLLRKNPDYYKKYNWQVPPNKFYLWPVNSNKTFRVVVPYWFKNQIKKEIRNGRQRKSTKT